MSKPKRVRIIGDHPHRGKTGIIQDERMIKLGMWRVVLDQNVDHMDTCFAAPENLRSLPADEVPYA